MQTRTRTRTLTRATVPFGLGMLLVGMSGQLYGPDAMGPTAPMEPGLGWGTHGAVVTDHCGDCYSGYSGEQWIHIAQSNPSSGLFTEGSAWHGSPLPGGCGTNHSPDCAGCQCVHQCGGDSQCYEQCVANECMPPGGFASLSELVRSGAMDARALATTRRAYEINEARGALQVIGCNDRVIAHIPLPVSGPDVVGARLE